MKQILTRVLLTLPVVWVVVSLVFLLIHLVPGDPVQQMLGEGATAADLAQPCVTNTASTCRWPRSICTTGATSSTATWAGRSVSMTPSCI
jgi:ABC-type dipeptide/oligopeptide/nickel transport system permease component